MDLDETWQVEELERRVLLRRLLARFIEHYTDRRDLENSMWVIQATEQQLWRAHRLALERLVQAEEAFFTCTDPIDLHYWLGMVDGLNDWMDEITEEILRLQQ